VQIWFNPKCSKCRLAAEMLEESGTEFGVRRYLDEPPTVAELADLLDKLGLEPWDITRMGEPVAEELGLAERPRVREDWIGLLAEHPILIQRPIIVTDDGEAWVARDEDAVKRALHHPK
jgi:arsenate reductase